MLIVLESAVRTTHQASGMNEDLRKRLPAFPTIAAASLTTWPMSNPVDALPSQTS